MVLLSDEKFVAYEKEEADLIKLNIREWEECCVAHNAELHRITGNNYGTIPQEKKEECDKLLIKHNAELSKIDSLHKARVCELKKKIGITNDELYEYDQLKWKLKNGKCSVC